MNFTLHLTEACNMNCAYCTREKRAVRMSEEVLDAACDLAFAEGSRAGLCFFGGEPLLERGLIQRAVSRCADLSRKTRKPVQYRMTTNGTLLDDEFLALALRENIEIGLSFDGTAQDIARHYADGRGTMAVLEAKAKALLRVQPHCYAMMTIAPQAAGKTAESVKYLYQLGFRRITMTPAYGFRVSWDDSTLALLMQQLREIAAFWSACILQGDAFYFSPLDAKIRECITGSQPAERCHLGFRQMPVAPDGKIYACTQFIGDADYCLGDVFRGLDREKQRELARRDAAPDSCRECALRPRCTNSCGCLNRLETGDERRVSPMQCSYEHALIELADAAADRLYAAAPQRFAKRYQ